MTTVIDVSGPRGADGLDGSYATIYNSGYKSGNHGSDATNPTWGVDAGGQLNSFIKVQIIDNIDGASIECLGKYRPPGYGVYNYQKTFSCKNVNVFILRADGARGDSGMNATRGANGGRGGTITLQMDDTDSGLLMLFVTAWTPSISYSLDVNGGNGGKAGRHGTPGKGGPGGRGGSSYSWSETHHDRNGNRITRYYTNPGGSSGPWGSDGQRPTFTLFNGIAGINGIFRFLIKNSITNVVTEYNEIYDIRLQNVITHSTTGAYEPDAQIIIDSINVYNKSNTPTPRSPPLRGTDLLHLTATMTGLERMFPAFDINGHSINIQFPIELTRVSHMNSMVVGHVTKVIWEVKNTSNVDFGAQAKNKRLIRVRLGKVGGEILPSALKFGLKPDQQGVSTIPPVQNMENEYIFEIPLLRAGKTLKLEAVLTLIEAEAFEYVDFWLYLELGKIAEPSIPKIIHILSFDVRASTIYRGFPQGFYPDVLLVTNHKTTRNEYLAWVKLFKEILGLRFFIWDISQMGHFSLMKDITTLYSNEPTTLMKDLSGKTIIVLNNEFEYGEYGQKFTPQNFILKHEWIEAIHKNDNNAGKNECVNILDELLINAFEEFRENKSEFENCRGFTQYLMGKEKDPLVEIPPDNIEENITEENITEKNIPEKNIPEENIPEENDSEENDSEENNLEEDNYEQFDIRQLTNDPAKLINEITEVHIRPKFFFNMEKRMRKKASKIDKNLRKLRPHFQHHVIYQWNNVKLRLFQFKKNREKKGGNVIIIPSMTTTKRRLIFSAASWRKSTVEFISSTINLRGIIAGLGIDNHFRILEMIFITGPLDDDEEVNDIGLFLMGGHRILNEEEKHVAELLKQQIIYDIAVELSTICDGIGGNSSLKDEEILVIMENLRRLVWKVESLSGKTCLPQETTNENLLPTISEENEDTSSLLLTYETELEQTNALLNNEMEPEQTNLDENINCSDIIPNCSDVIPNCSDIIPDINDKGTTFNGFDTAGGDVGVENEIIFYMFPVKQDTPLGEWMMDTLAQLYAFIKCLRSGIYQSILPNRRTAKMQQQSMDLLHRIGDATIVDFTDPRSSEKLEYLNAKIDNCVLKENDIENEELFDLPTSSLKKKISLNSINYAASSLKEKTSLGSINGVELSLSNKESLSSIYGVVDSQDSFPDNSVPTNLVSIQYDNSTEIPSLMSIASGLSFASSMTRATKMSSSSFSYSGPSASRSRIPYKKLDPTRQKTIKSFKKGAKLQLRIMIQKYYKQWKKESGILDLSRKDLRRKAMETIFEPFEQLVDNTLYGRNFQKKGDGLVGGVKNIIISYSKYNKLKEAEMQRIDNMEDIIVKFRIFQKKMILDTIIE
ncbi:29581_t:CDS:10 [Gigaspora margarita]|uniref:29581_t:CDS:1 n=1 Tax=Gigaspora margarita TaxID=4874 RepID=A0ABN7UC48_GIGMA|nr:29581_t:CDS:10 [Gigaspora margarita]